MDLKADEDPYHEVLSLANGNHLILNSTEVSRAIISFVLMHGIACGVSLVFTV